MGGRSIEMTHLHNIMLETYRSSVINKRSFISPISEHKNEQKPVHAKDTAMQRNTSNM